MTRHRPSLPDVARLPDRIRIVSETGNANAVAPTGNGDAELRFTVTDDGLELGVRPLRPLCWVQLRWSHPLPGDLRILSDAWERSYGDLEWRGHAAQRALPWYWAGFDGKTCAAFGVATGAGAMGCWQVDPEGVTLLLDLRSGGAGVLPSGREIHAARIVSYHGTTDETPFAVVSKLCARMCQRPRLPAEPVFGSNNWYAAYGRFTADEAVRQAALVAELSPTGPVRPWMVVDDGWQENDGRWERGNERVGDTEALARRIRAAGCRPGLWIRVLQAPADAPVNRLLPASRCEPAPMWGTVPAWDPTIPENIEGIRATIRRLRTWGFEMIKHDFSTYDLLGYWGFQTGYATAAAGWSFADRTRTTAEVISGLYAVLCEAAGESLLLGCNAVGHLAAGTHEIQRTGCDTSGREWERTRAMGVNALAFRLPQHNRFFACDADCVGLTRAVPWRYNAQWLDLVARSGTPLFVSFEDEALGVAQRSALREAFARAAEPASRAEPSDWINDRCPQCWCFNGEDRRYDWYEEHGVQLTPATPRDRRIRGHYE